MTSEDRRARILEAATRLCAERGFHGVRTRDLAAEAGVSEALLFRHFPTKEALIRAVMGAQDTGSRIAEATRVLRALPPREALLELTERFFDALEDQSQRMRLHLFGILELPVLAEEFYRDYAEPLLRAEVEVFRRAAAERAAAERSAGREPGPAPDPEVAARAFHGTLMFYNLRQNVFRAERLPDDRHALAQSVVDLFLPK